MVGKYVELYMSNGPHSTIMGEIKKETEHYIVLCNSCYYDGEVNRLIDEYPIFVNREYVVLLTVLDEKPII